VTARQEDFVFAEHALRHGYATEEQVQECLALLERLRGEMELDETLRNLLVKKGYLAPAQAQVVEREINPESGKVGNAIPGYQLLGRIGSGAMGSVYKAHHRKLDIPVALKVLRPSLAASRTQIERLQREARLAAQLNHPNIVRSLDVGESRGWHYMAMEFVDGTTVRARLDKGPLPEKEALRIVKEVAKALDHANAHGVIHRDVKPGNIMLTPDGKVKLADFGLARGKGPSDLTLEHASIGTPQYLAPEQAVRGSNATHRSDLFSLGASLYHLATGRPPFAGENLGEIFHNVVQCKFEPPERIQKDLSLDTVYVIHRLMRANPKERYANAAELVADLERMERGERVAPADFLGDYARYLRRRRARLAAVTALAVAVVAVAATLAVSWYRTQNARVALQKRCAVVDATGADRIEGLATAGQLRSLLGELRRARGETDCPDDLVVGLQARVGRLESDEARMDRADGMVAQAREADASFETLHEGVRGLAGGSFFKLTEEYLDAAAKTIADLSDKAQRVHRNSVYGAGRDRTDLLDALKAYEKDLKERYLDTAGELTEVSLDRQSVERLLPLWEQSEAGPGRDSDRAIAERRFDAAWTLRKRFVEQRQTALERNPLSTLLRRHFRLPEDPEAELRDVELPLFEDEVKRPVRALLDAGRLEDATRLLLTVEWQPHFSKGDLASLKREADEKTQARREAQQADLARLVAEFGAELRARRVLRLYSLVLAAKEEWTDWLPANQAHLEALLRHAQSLAAIYNRFKTQVQEKGFQESQDDPYHFRSTGKKPEEFFFTSLTMEEILETLALTDKNAGHASMDAYVRAMEAHADRDPRRRRDRAREALKVLGGPPDPWLDRLAAVAKADLEPREAEAGKLYQDFLSKREAQDHELALQLCRDLLDRRRDSLRYTRLGEDRRSFLEGELKKLRRLAGAEAFRTAAGLPPDAVRGDAYSGTVACTFTFREWFPDVGNVPQDVRSQGEEAVRAWLLEQGRKYWDLRFRADPQVPKEAYPELYRRARHQLRFFNDAVDVDGSGRAVLQVDRLREALRELYGHPVLQVVTDTDALRLGWRKIPDAVPVVEIENPFDLNRDWHIEGVLEWPDVHPPDTPKAEPAPQDYPFYLAVTAGQVQAGVWWKEKGGARMFKQDSVHEGIDGLFAFCAPQVEKRTMKNKDDLAFYDKWERGKAYWFRLENAGTEVRFYLAPAGAPPPTEPLVRKAFGSKELEEALGPVLTRGPEGPRPGRTPVFRIVSLGGCRIRSIELKGQLPEEER